MAIIDSVNGRAPRADTLFSAGTVAVTMGWRGLLRVVDFQALLSSQPLVASALDKAQHAGGTRSPEAKALREGYHLLAKVLWTRRRHGAPEARACRSCSQLRHSRIFRPNRRAWSRIMQWSWTTVLPAARAFFAASSFRIPSCIQITFAGPGMACSTIGGTSAEGRKMSTASYGTGTASRDGYAFSPRISVAVGFTGMIRYPCCCMYFGTRCASLVGSFEHPTTAIVRMVVRIFRIVASSVMARPIHSSPAFRLRFRRNQSTDRVLQGRCQIQHHRVRGREPANLRMFLVRNPHIALPPGHDEEVVAEKVSGCRVDVFVNPQEPRADDLDP